ncbi:MAG: YlmC/YmxH family sporulation protein [Clostridia bacterium]|nr:YlmC/YmxH family sporulation protein [Clostridia bacterium]
MELSFSDLKRKDVINTPDGKRLGRITDMVFCYPENRILGFVVPCGKFLKKEEFFIDVKNVVRIGLDVVLVNVGVAGRPNKDGGDCKRGERPRTFEEYE